LPDSDKRRNPRGEKSAGRISASSAFIKQSGVVFNVKVAAPSLTGPDELMISFAKRKSKPIG
jgi:hypothetical protein